MSVFDPEIFFPVFKEDKDILNRLTGQDLGGNYSPGKLDTMVPITLENKPYILSHAVPKMIYNNTHFDIIFFCTVFNTILIKVLY